MDYKEITLDVSKEPSSVRVVRVGEKDVNGTVLTVNVLDHGEAFDMTDLTASLLMAFGDERYSFDGTISGSSAVFVIDAQSMNSGSTDNAYVSIEGEDFILSTGRFPVEVLESAERS